MKRYKFTVEYDGSKFFGWQHQSIEPTVQGTLEDQLVFFVKHPVTIHGAGRTDAGVHATGQVAHADLEYPHSPYRLQVALNHFLSQKGISIVGCEEVDETFHSRFSAVYRCYEYKILNRTAPGVHDSKVWHVARPLDVQAMENAAKLLIGTHDFSSFRDSRCQSNTPIKTLSEFSFEKCNGTIIAHMKAPSFLHHQVRIMIGTLKSVGAGVITISEFGEILHAKDRTKAGITSPPDGLSLTEVGYS